MATNKVFITITAIGVGIVLLMYEVMTTVFPSDAVSNCDESLVSVMRLDANLESRLYRRNCGMLYGGPFTVVKISNRRFPLSAFGELELIELTDSLQVYDPKIVRGKSGWTLQGINESSIVFRNDLLFSAYGIGIKNSDLR
jgi:hypothetical protein